MKTTLLGLFLVLNLSTQAFGEDDFPEKYKKIFAVKIQCVDVNGGPAKVEMVPVGLVSRFWDDDGEANYYNRYQVTITGTSLPAVPFEMRRFGYDTWDKFFRGVETVGDLHVSLVGGSKDKQNWNPIRAGLHLIENKNGQWGDDKESFSLSCRFEGELPPL